jgi:hypothetical protein
LDAGGGLQLSRLNLLMLLLLAILYESLSDLNIIFHSFFYSSVPHPHGGRSSFAIVRCIFSQKTFLNNGGGIARNLSGQIF